MVDYNDPAQIELRKTQEDPIVMYLIVREELGMSVGKTGAQCAHAAQILLLDYIKRQKEIDWISVAHRDNEGMKILSDHVMMFQSWLDSSFRKVVLKADDKEWVKLKAELLLPISIVVDAGLTELNPNTETVMGVWPMRKSEVPKVIKRLQVLK